MTSLTHSMTPSLPNVLLTTLKSTPPSPTLLTIPAFKTTSTLFIHGHLPISHSNATYSKLANASNRSTITRFIYHKFHSLYSNRHLTSILPSITPYLSIIISKALFSMRTSDLISYTDVSSPKMQPHFFVHYTKFTFASCSNTLLLHDLLTRLT